LDAEIAYDAQTQVYTLSVLRGGTVLAGIQLNGLTGDATMSASGTLTLKAPKIVIDSDTQTTISSGGTVAMSSTNANITTQGVLTMMKEVIAGLNQIALTKHQHQYVNVNTPSQTTPPIVVG
jgi:hypothetical protein